MCVFVCVYVFVFVRVLGCICMCGGVEMCLDKQLYHSCIIEDSQSYLHT